MIENNWDELWNNVLNNLEKEILKEKIKVWIQPLVFVEKTTTDDGLSILLNTENEFNVDWINTHYLEKINSALSKELNCKVIVTVKAQKQAQSNPFKSDLSDKEPRFELPTVSVFQSKKETHSQSKPHLDLNSHIESNIDPRFTFNTFIVGASNQYARASAYAIAEKPGTHQYNPLFIHSAPGLGKTHLLHAVGNHILKNNPKSRILYMTAENFMNELIESIQHGNMVRFRNKFRNSFDCILIDDIQFIAGKGSTEEEFFHTFNSIHGSQRQIVLTSDRSPKDIDGLEERIRTRFEWGLVVDILTPEIETRIAILKNRAEKDDIYLPEDVCVFLATHVKSNIRELEGILARLQMQASLSGAEITLDMAKNELKNTVPEESTQYTAEAIQTAVSKFCQIKTQELKGTSRAKTVSLPRQVAFYLIRKYTGLGYKEIGGFFGGKDHTTIMYACQKIEDGIQNNDDEIKNLVEGVRNQL